MSPRHVFLTMLDNNLATESITRHTVQRANGQVVDQYIQLQFGRTNASRSLVTVKQPEEGGESVVKSETIGTPQNDFSRYVSIKTTQKNSQGQPIDTSKVTGVWGKTDDSKDGERANTQYFQQGALGIVPFANLTSEQRQKLVNLMRDKKVYDVDFSKVKSVKEKGKSAFVYNVNISPKSYMIMIKQFTKYLGLSDMGLDPSQYENSPPLKTEFTVDKLSRNLIKIHYTDSSQDETFSSYGLEQPISLPTKTISITELQKRVQDSLQ